MMYSSILSLICTAWILLIPCAASVIVSDTVASGALWAPYIHDKIVPNKVRAVLNAAEARSTPVDSALRQLNVHEKASPSRARAVDRRANEPRETFAGNIWQPTTHAGVAARQPVVKRAEGPVGGFLFQDAVHDKIADS
ncbi:hypothetical protein DFJ58DRAFT_801978 [Suillus subalutaceus]|uniref:uncharacterized protein n=1 Tax=Suillus subalutaceus TaxID=48586 RepID=UPI001B87B980|nr:uncharacterized protein DFJ58DRAFT_801978 [Suillus subalutaceus]KAG1844825.1 hypothetical protein DFJ58DRAFT_801978 [Suillus subalutaceus]